MGLFTSKPKENCIDGEVCFDHFQVLRAIGRGSFGKVCIVQKRNTGQMFAMKYVNKEQCEEKEALSNIFREIEILSIISHPFLVNLWYSFQDAEDMFMVGELLLGGDLRYHLQQGKKFGDQEIRIYALEIGSALTYLHGRNIMHRDVKPDNLLLDEEGHVHLTDFNIATEVKPGQKVTSMSGTRPYMAPEIYMCAADEGPGYSLEVDWWSLGVVLYEVRTATRPYDIHSTTSLPDIKMMFLQPIKLPGNACDGVVELILKLLIMEPQKRLTDMEDIRKIKYFSEVQMEEILNKKIKPGFCPPRDHLNCDPTFELEEMIIESRPLHKKKKRLSKQKSLTHSTTQSGNTEVEREREGRYGGMLVFNREVEERRKEKERKEREREERERRWQEELEESMKKSDPTGQGCSFTGIKVGKRSDSPNFSSHPLPPVLPPDPSVTSSVRVRISRSPRIKVKVHNE